MIESWTLLAQGAQPDGKAFAFSVSGSVTGPDGEGRSDQRFVSRSGRIVIETNDWNVAYAMSLANIKSVPPEFSVRWKVEARFADEWISPGVQDPSTETTVTIAQGLPNTKHTLEISGSDAVPISAVRIYHPPQSSRERR